MHNACSRSTIITLIALIGLTVLLSRPAGADDTLRVFSWNASVDAFADEPAIFRALLAWADPDVVLLDEVDPQADLGVVREALAALRPDSGESWTITRGASGGRQRGVIASRFPLVDAPELAGPMPYPQGTREQLDRLGSEGARDHYEVGIPAHGAVVDSPGGKLLVVTTDLRCCGDGPASRQEAQRRLEAGEIQKRIRQVMTRTPVDAVIVAGDFNTIAGPAPLEILAGPYPAPHGLLARAEPRHADSLTTWTWDGRGTPFPSRPLDHQLYAPARLQPGLALVLDTETAPPEIPASFGLGTRDIFRMGEHRPIVVEYTWVPAARAQTR